MMKKIFLTLLFFICFNAKSHEIKPAVVDFFIIEDIATLYFNINSEVVLADINASKYEDTNDAPEAAQYNYFRELSNIELEEYISKEWGSFSKKINIQSNGQLLDLNLIEVDVEVEPNLEFTRDTILKVQTKIDKDFVIVFDGSFGSVVVRQFKDLTKNEVLFAEFLQPGEISPILSNNTGSSFWGIALEYLFVGVEHIVPKGLDHILFVLGLFFFSIKLKPLLMQVTMFTLAHSFTLILATFNLIFIPASIVEPLIALSISYVAFENIFPKKLKFSKYSSLTRYFIIFVFGLIHGLGFAFVLGDIGLDSSQLVLSLISFNIGVELAQIGIIVVMYLLMIIPSKRTWYKKLIQFPLSALIGLVGFYWFIERVFF
jgi:hypothetical protein